MSIQTLDDMVALLQRMPEDEVEAMLADADDILGDTPWIPNPGPQTAGYHSSADVLLYGGQGGGGKTDMLAGLALTEHKNTLLLRVQYTDLGALIDRVTDIAGTTKGLNKSPPPRFSCNGRIIDFGAASTLEKAQTWQGHPHDLIGFDEACQFSEPVVRFIMGWNRAADDQLGTTSTQRVRTVLASNPPLTAEGQWIVGMFRPWLDPAYPTNNRAEHGELRWYVTDPDNNDVEVEGPHDVQEYDGKRYIPRSRTFIPAALGDNPFLINTGYQATMDAMPEPLRSAIRDGNFMAAREDDAFQVIPTSWVLEANDRWRNSEPRGPMSALGADVARGGRDDSVLTPRWATYFGEQIVVPGRQTPDGPTFAALCAQHLREGGVVGVDPIGVGTDAETSLRNAHLPYEALNGSEGSSMMTRDGNFKFKTRRSEMWWMLREALDPTYGRGLAIPPDPTLLADLTAPTYTVHPGTPPKLYVESKPDIMKRLHRSPDRGDSLVYAWNAGSLTGASTTANDAAARGKIGATPKATGYDYDPRRY